MPENNHPSPIQNSWIAKVVTSTPEADSSDLYGPLPSPYLPHDFIETIRKSREPACRFTQITIHIDQDPEHIQSVIMTADDPENSDTPFLLKVKIEAIRLSPLLLPDQKQETSSCTIPEENKLLIEEEKLIQAKTLLKQLVKGIFCPTDCWIHPSPQLNGF